MRSKWMALFCMLCGAVVGSFVGELCSKVSWLGWLGWREQFGLSIDNPLDVDLIVMRLRFGLSFDISVCTILFIFIALIVYYKMVR